MKLRIKGRLAFPALFEAKTVNGEGKPAFSASILSDGQGDWVVQYEKTPKTETTPAVWADITFDKALEQVAKNKWGAKGLDILKSLKAADKVCLHNGDAKSDYDGFPGNYFVSCRNEARPLVIGLDKSPLTAADGKPYAGCYVTANIELWPQDNKYGKRINASLRGVQFLRDGDAFTGGGAAGDDEFDDVAEGAEAADFA